MKILSLGAGMQSTALALMACENAMAKENINPLVPIYDAVIFCDLGFEPPWVKYQLNFILDACNKAGIFATVLRAPLYEDFIDNFGKKRTVSIPWWTLDENGKKGKMPRNCTLDYKIKVITQYVRWELLGYKKGQRLKPEDIKAHELHIGFSKEEQKRCKENPHKLFINKFPLVEMGFERKDSYKYILETWGLETKASACTFCPFHRNYFFSHIKDNCEDQYEAVLEVDDMLEQEGKNINSKYNSELFISRSRKRIKDLTCEECQDAEYFDYRGTNIWNGF